MYSIGLKALNNSSLLHAYFKKTVLPELQHTINQPLSAVLNYINGCIYSLESQDHPNPHTEIINALQHAGIEIERTGKILKNLCHLFHRGTQPLYIQAIDINALLKKLICDLESTLEQSNITVHLCLAENLSVAHMSKQYKNTLVCMIISAIDLIAIEKNQLTLKVITQQRPGYIIIEMITDKQKIFSLPIALRR